MKDKGIKNIITITGPRSVGKSTVSKLVAEKLKLGYISSDEIGDSAMKEYGGLDGSIKSGIINKIIKDSAYSLIKQEYEKNNFVFDLSGGSISSEKYPEASEQVRKIAKGKSLVIGLLPSNNSEEAVEFLFEREKERDHFKDMDKNELFEKTIRSYNKFPPIFSQLCDIIIYTKGKSSEIISDEIVDFISSLK